MKVLLCNGSDSIEFLKGECIHTENSYKFSSTDFESMGIKSGLRINQIISDKNNWFSIVCFSK